MNHVWLAKGSGRYFLALEQKNNICQVRLNKIWYRTCENCVKHNSPQCFFNHKWILATCSLEMSVYPNTLGPRTLDIPTTIIPTMAPVGAPPFTTSDRSTLHTIEAFIPSNSPMIIPRIPISSNDSSIIWLVDVGGTIFEKRWKIWVRQWLVDYPIYEMENKSHVWNHQIIHPLFTHIFPYFLLIKWDVLNAELHEAQGIDIVQDTCWILGRAAPRIGHFCPQKERKTTTFFFCWLKDWIWLISSISVWFFFWGAKKL